MRTWLGAAVLAAVLAAGLVMGAAVQRQLAPAAQALRQAESAALAEDWDAAVSHAAGAEARWRRAAPLCHQDTLDRIDAAFAQLSTAAKLEDRAAWAAQCTALARDLEALGDTFGCHWEQFW